MAAFAFQSCIRTAYVGIRTKSILVQTNINSCVKAVARAASAYKTSQRRALMITKDQEEKINQLKARGYSQFKVATELNISRATVARHWGGERKLSINDLFIVSSCSRCGTVFPKPKFLPTFKCPYCKAEFEWREPQFTPENKNDETIDR
jgi:predicted Zn-ribbon and HTH transcriptional regulator